MNIPLFCRSCGQRSLHPVLSLGRIPLANALVPSEQLDLPEPTYPLDLVFCPHCTLVQLTEVVPPDQLFREYVYFSSFSDTMLRHVQELVERLVAARGLGEGSLVVEIASNDGYLLQFYRRHRVPVLGIEPARNIAQVAREQRHIPTVCEFFDEALARGLLDQGKRADVVHAHNVLAHVPDLNGVVRGLEGLLKDHGIAIIEVPYIKDMIDHGEFDTIYHEHLCYFSLTALDRLFGRHGLIVEDVERVPIHGGSLRLFVAPSRTSKRSMAVTTLLEAEAAWGVEQAEFYQGFGRRVTALKDALRRCLEELKRQGKRIAAYGAAAKGTTLLNYCGIGREIVDFVADRSPVKQGQFTPGTHLLIRPPEALLEDMPDYVVLLAWNVAEEILEQQHEYHRRGGRFILPLPEVRVI